RNEVGSFVGICEEGFKIRFIDSSFQELSTGSDTIYWIPVIDLSSLFPGCNEDLTAGTKYSNSRNKILAEMKNWQFASVDHMKAFPPPITRNYMPPSNIPDIDESQIVYGKKATDSSEIKNNDDSISHSPDSECSRPNHSDHDSKDSISSVSASASESSDTIVIDCTRQEDFSSVCHSSFKTDVKSSRILCNKFRLFNKGSHFRKHKSCYVCGSYLHLIKDYDLHEQKLVKRHAEGKGILGRRLTGKPINLSSPNPVSAGQSNLVFAGQPNPVSAGQPNPVSAGQSNLVSAGQQNIVSAGLPNPVFAGQPNPVYASDGLLGPRPLNIQPSICQKQRGPRSMVDQNPRAGLLLKGNSPRMEKAKDRGVVDSGCSRSMSGNKDKLKDFKHFDGGEVTFGGSTCKISWKGTIKTKTLNFENVLYIEELQHFNLISVSQICDQTHRALFTENECLV
nr:ribonuclease H-like domain-containing protein [Tanacetum cinerariifolium]